MPKKKDKKPSTQPASETVTVTNEYFERIANNVQAFKGLINKPFPPKPGYWIARAVSKIESLSRPLMGKEGRPA